MWLAELLPPKERPKTTTAVARRLMSHHLGLQGLRDKHAEEELRVARRSERDRRLRVQQLQRKVWEEDEAWEV